MLLLIDCGNTNIVFAIAQNDRILKKWRITRELRINITVKKED